MMCAHLGRGLFLELHEQLVHVNPKALTFFVLGLGQQSQHFFVSNAGEVRVGFQWEFTRFATSLKAANH
jgi:hypothetical protein